MKIIRSFLLLFCVSITLIQAQSETENKQDKKKSSFFSRFSLGGNVGFSLGDPVFANVSPLLGYRISERFQAGLGVSYIYQNPKSTPPQHLYGGRAYSKYQVLGPLFVWGELEGLNTEELRQDGSTIRTWQWAPLLGGGLQLSLGERAKLYFTVLYNVAHDDKSWRGTPWETRFGFGF